MEKVDSVLNVLQDAEILLKLGKCDFFLVCGEVPP